MHRAIAGAALPLLLSSVTGLAGSLVVTSVLGRHETAALAAYALTTAVHHPALMAVVGGLRGLGPFVAPFRDDPPAVVPVLRDARWLALLIGTAGAVAVACAPLIAALSGVRVAGFGVLPVTLALSLLVSASNGGANIVLVSLGRSRQVLWSSAASTLVVVILVPVMVPAWGLTGAGVAFLCSSLAGAGIANLALRRVLGRPVGRGRPRVQEITRIARVSLPLSGTLLIKFAGLGVVAYAAARTGVAGSAAHAILYSLTGFLMLPALAVAQASVPEIARANGMAGKRHGARVALTLAICGAGAGVLVVLLLMDPLTRAFTTDVAVRAQVTAVAALMLSATLADAGNVVMGFGLTAMKRSSSSLRSLAIGWGLMATAAGPVAGAWGLPGLWTAMLATNLLLLALQGSAFLSATAGG
ncbi:polysaccharide biosynthesis C-terminal domain-containing protein [Nonomuraea africana]|uniref:MATE family multidrug resistance protein n=1 Tax=Nonomuraea africana TaxID=46171 RepID=A0ABR9KPS4_9ACTN|nr:polysaccharide biosynthesis C-terminal domain-containing protein [Nonomuraea africana]MBE1563756.1 MATE family multidrug resistance protein [Nonomuraea africana]